MIQAKSKLSILPSSDGKLLSLKDNSTNFTHSYLESTAYVEKYAFCVVVYMASSDLSQSIVGNLGAKL